MNETKKEMIDFIINHDTYWPQNSWNGGNVPCVNVKLYSNFIKQFATEEYIEKAFDFLDCEEAFDDIHYFIFEPFHEDYPKYKIGWNGRSKGYIVLRDAKYPFRSVFNYSKDELNEMTKSKIKNIYEILKEFDNVVVRAVTSFFDYVKTYKRIMKKDTYTKNVPRFIKK